MTLTIGTRLTSYFTALFGALVVALVIAAYLLARKDVYSELDSALRAAVDGTAMSANHELNEHDRKEEGEADLQSVLSGLRNGSQSDLQILVREGDRQVAYKSGSWRHMNLRSIPSANLRHAIQIGGARIASTELPISKFHTSYQIYSMKPVEPALVEVRFLSRAFLIAVPLGLAFAALCGYLLAMKTLAPLKALTNAIDATTSRDLTARVHLSNPKDEIGQLGARFNSLLERLQKAFDLQRDFMADASHELRTPMTIALAAAQVTIRDARRTKQDCEDAIEIVEQQMLRLKRIIEDMSFLSQADLSCLRVDFRDTYLDEAVSEAGRSARTLARAKQQSFTIGECPEAKCLGDPDLLKQAILILLDNAVKFTPQGGTIEINLRQKEAFWICGVTDSGVGIADAAQPQVFDRFFRAAEAVGIEKVSGAGLGLAIAKSIVETHGGTLRLVESRPGRTTFEMAIPVAAETSASNTVQPNASAVSI